MTTSVITSLENSVQKTNVWIHEVAEQLDCDTQQAYHALRAVLHALRDRISTVEIADLGSQLPLVIRGLLYENWRPNQHEAVRTREEFLDRIYQDFTDDFDMEAAAVARGVFEVICRHVSAGEVEDIKCNLTQEIRELWP